MRVITKIANAFDHLLDVFRVLSIVLLSFLMLSVTYAVIQRYVFNANTKGLFELWEYSLLYCAMLGSAWLVRRGGHIGVDIVLEKLQPKAQVILRTTTAILCAAVCFTLLWYGTLVSWESFRSGFIIMESELYPPEYPILMIIPIGFFLLIVEYLRLAYRFAKGGQYDENPEVVDTG